VSATALWLMVAGMGVYQGLNPPMGWLYAVSRALERRSTGAALSGTAALAAGHYVAMLAVLLPASLVFALAFADPMAVQPWLGVALIGFGLFKLYRPSHPRFLVRIPPDRAMRWSCAMALTHCGSPIMMLGPLLTLLMILDMGGFAGGALGPRVGWFAAAAFAVPAAMAATLLLTASAMAVLVYRRLGLGVLTRFWINLDLGWAVVFVAMGAMALMMSAPQHAGAYGMSSGKASLCTAVDPATAARISRPTGSSPAPRPPQPG
jgi:hypothetical protein